MKDIIIGFITRFPQCGLREKDAHKWRPLDFSPDRRAFYTHRTFTHWGEIHSGNAITDGDVVFAMTFNGRFIECKLDNLDRHLFHMKKPKFFPGMDSEDDVRKLIKVNRLKRPIIDITNLI